jgi:putative ABC transport system substrate-binding protein
MPATVQAAAVWDGLERELADDFDVVTARIEKDSKPADIAEAIAQSKPACVVILNNPTLRLYKQYQQGQPKGSSFPPAIVAMTSFLEQSYRDVQNATGIAYEVPAVIQFVKLRSLVTRPVQRVGVAYRGPFRAYIQRETQLAKMEQIEIVGREVPREPDQAALKTALSDLLSKDHVDALWVLNDNALLTPDLIGAVWVPEVSGETRVPVIVGVPSLLSKSYPVGTFAMVPDHAALGMQAANLVFDLSENGWRIQEPSIKLPISIKTLVRFQEVRQRFGLKDGGLESVENVDE